MTAVPTGVVEQFLHPPLSVMSRELVSGTSSGSGTLTRVRGPIQVDAFGIETTFVTVPAGFGLVDGDPRVYTERIVQLAVEHTLIDSSSVYSQVQDVYFDGQLFLWDLALPAALHFYCAPGVTVQFRWLLAL